MKKIYFIIGSLGLATLANAQIPEDALKLSWTPQMGSARFMSIGGTMIGLGGEITSAHTNPAGLGFFKNSELVLSPGFGFGRNNIDYRGINGQKGTSTSNFNLGTSGLILAGAINNSNIKGAAFSLTANKTADYNNRISYKGFNNQSSGAERYAEELVNSRYSLNDALNSRFVSLPTRMAIYTYLIDTMTLGGTKQVVAMPEFTNGVNQENNVISSGGATELAVSLAINKNDKLFIGGSVGLPIMNYNRETNYKESDASTVLNNRFGSFSYSENLTTRGFGFNGKLGIIYRPVEKVRFGATIHTPTIYSLTDKTSGTMNTNTENYNGIANVSTIQITGSESIIESKYSFITPWRIGIGGSYVFNEVKDVRKQKAFIAADIEYVTYKTMRYSGVEEDIDTNEFYKGTNNGIKSIYKNAFNFKLGGEIKFNTIMVRLGGAYFGNPNKDANILNQNRINLSGGLGYRHKGIFIDATYVHQMGRSIDMAYRLADKANTFADVRGTNGMVMLTFGTKF